MTKLSVLLAIIACGLLAVRAHGESRIVGGRNATNGQFPHIVQIQNIEHTHEYPHCSGSIIGDHFILTAAQCFELSPHHDHGNNLRALRVVVGEVDLRVDAVTHMVDKLVIHPDASILQHNIAVLRVAQPFKFTANVRAIQLPTGDTPVDSNGLELPTIIAGWGRQKYMGDNSADPRPYPKILQWLDTLAISHSECRRRLEGDHGAALKDHHICAKSTGSAKPGACDADQGSGLITRGAQPVIIGVFSLISNACVRSEPGLYTRAFPYLAFIRSAMQQ